MRTTMLSTIKIIDSSLGLLVEKLFENMSWNDPLVQQDLESEGITYHNGYYATKETEAFKGKAVLALGKASNDELYFRKHNGVYDFTVDKMFTNDLINVLNTSANYEKCNDKSDIAKENTGTINTYRVGVKLTDGYGSSDGTMFYEVKTTDARDIVIKNIKRAAELTNKHVWLLYSCYEVFFSVCYDTNYDNCIKKDEFETMESVFTEHGTDSFVAYVKKKYGYEIELVKASDVFVSIWE